ncbi:MAG: M14 family zinc carboxypeptidase [Planctomycetota bacterium]|jgi:hypothetical protein
MAILKKDVLSYLLVLVSLVSVAPAVAPEAAVFEVGSRSAKVIGSDEKLGEVFITLAIPKPQVKEVTARNGEQYAQIKLEGCGNDNTVGLAALPIITHVVEVPWDTKVTAIVIRRHFEEFSVKRRLYPHQPPIPKVPGPAGNPPFQLNEEFYSGRKSDSFKTAGRADKVDVRTYRKRGRQYAKLAVRPFECNPAKRLVRYPTELVLKVTYARELPRAAGPRAGVISVVEVTIAERRELEELVEAGYNISNVRGNVVTIYATLKELGSLKAMGLEPVVIERQGPGIPKRMPPGKKGLGVYHDYATLTAELQAYAADYNDVCMLSSLGTSVQGRQLWAVKITDNPDVEEDEPEFKYVATMHGDEPVGTEMCLYFIDMLLTNYGLDANITDLVDSTEIWVVPLMNPDGLELGTRFNAHGINLNRAFPEGSSNDYMNILTGPYNNTAGRPPEVAHVMRWSQAGSFVLSANFHTGALVVNYPYDNDGLGSVDSPTPDDLLFEDVARRYSYYNPRFLLMA